MRDDAVPRRALVLGASGFTGRHLVLALLEAGADVVTATRSERSAAALRGWLSAHGLAEAPRNVLVDFTATELLPGGPEAFADLTEIHNCAGAFRFGMSNDEARSANVATVEAIVAFAARLPGLTRIVHVSGYRVGGADPQGIPWSEEERRASYARLGAYEASKVEADAVFRARAEQHGLPWTVVNPATVIGHSETGESDQYLGLAASLKDLWHGALPALPGDGTTFVPIVTVDHLARFMALLPTDQTTVGQSYWLLDDETPTLPDLLAQVGQHYEVRVPRLRVPAGLLKRLPERITKADPETLTFLSSDRYPTGAAQEVATRHRLVKPDPVAATLAWADHLAGQRFGTASGGPVRGYRDVAGTRTFHLGDPTATTVVLPGLPVNADSWADLVRQDAGLSAVDLPGLGLSRGSGDREWGAWLTALTALTALTTLTTGGGLHLVGHSVGAAAALQAASVHPERVEQLTLVAPFFLQPTAGLLARVAPLTRAYLRRVTAAGLSRRLTGSASAAERLAPAVADLHRAGVAARVARLLQRTTSAAWRRDLHRLLAAYPGPVHIIVGADDPLTDEGLALLESLPGVALSIISGAGHHPQLTHADELLALIRRPRGPAWCGDVRAPRSTDGQAPASAGSGLPSSRAASAASGSKREVKKRRVGGS